MNYRSISFGMYGEHACSPTAPNIAQNGSQQNQLPSFPIKEDKSERGNKHIANRYHDELLIFDQDH